MTPEDITARLDAARERRISDSAQDRLMKRIEKVCQGEDPFDQMMVLIAAQAALMLDIADEDMEATKNIWDATYLQSSTLLKTYFKKMQERKGMH